MDEQYQEEDNPRNVKIPKNQGEHAVEGPKLGFINYKKPVKTCKVNIGIEKNLKFANIGDYWNDETIEKIVDLLCEYHDLFPTKFSEMKGISSDLGEMNIPLNPYSTPIKNICIY